MDVLVWRGGALGDFLLTLPAHAAIDRLAPGVRRTVLEREAFHELARRGAGAVAARDPSRGGFHALFSDAEPLPPDLRDWLARFDLLVGWVPGSTERLAARFSEAGVRRVILRSSFPPADTPEHVADWHVRTIHEALGETGPISSPRLFGGEPDPPRLPRACLHPGAGSAKKAWPARRFAELARRLRADHGLAIDLVSGPADETSRRELLSALAPEIPDGELHGLDLVVLAHHLSRASLFVGNDSGPTHLAAACGVPTLALYGPTDPAIWGARGAGPIRHVVSPTKELRDLDEYEVREACEEVLLEQSTRRG